MANINQSEKICNCTEVGTGPASRLGTWCGAPPSKTEKNGKKRSTYVLIRPIYALPLFHEPHVTHSNSVSNTYNQSTHWEIPVGKLDNLLVRILIRTKLRYISTPKVDLRLTNPRENPLSMYSRIAP